MKTILFTIEYPPFKGGVANYYYNLVKNWPRSDEIHILNDNGHKLISDKGPIKWLPAIFALRKTVKAHSIAHSIECATPHVIIGQILPLGTVVLILNLFRRKKNKISFTVILHGQDINYTFRFKRKQLLAKLILKQAKNIICNSNYTAKIVKKHYKDEFNGKLSVVNPGIEPSNPSARISATPPASLLRQGYGGQVGHLPLVRGGNSTFVFPLPRGDVPEGQRGIDIKNKFILFSLGRLVKRKGVDMTIEAMVKLVKTIPNIEYYFAGVGPDKQYLLSLIKMQAENLQKKIHYLGKVSEEEKWAWLKRADIFCQPSRNINGDVEGFGIVYLEAGLAGTPVIAGRGSGSEDAVEDYETGILVDGKYPDDIMEAVMEMYRKPALRAEMGEEGTRRVLKDFSWKEKARQVYEIVNN